jgi:cation transporter-like permease
MGAAITTAGAGLALGFGADGAVTVLLVALIAAAGLEALLGLCIGCKIFGLLMRAGLVPDDVCAECADIWSRPNMART